MTTTASIPAQECTIIIRNESSDVNEAHGYFVYFVDQGVTGGPVTQTLQPVLFSEPLNLDNQGQFKINSQLYAFWGRVDGDTNIPLPNYREISLKSQKPVDIGHESDNGDAVIVRYNKDLRQLTFDPTNRKTAEMGTFSICCDSLIPLHNSFVVGLARQIDRSYYRPVAVVPCLPGNIYSFTPKEEIFVERCRSQAIVSNGTIVSAGSRPFGPRACFGLNFGDAITISERRTSFYINGRLARDTPSSDEPPPIHRRSTSANEHSQQASTSGRPRSISPSRNQGRDQTRPRQSPAGNNPFYESQSSRRDQADRGRQSAPPSGAAGPAMNAASRPPPVPQSDQYSTSSERVPSNAAGKQREPPPQPEAPKYNATTAEDDDAQSDSEEEGAESLSRLENFHTVFIVDDTDSMILPAYGNYTQQQQVPPGFQGETRWQMVVEALEHIADLAMRYDESGIDVYFMCRTRHLRRGIKKPDELHDLIKRIEIGRGSGPTKFKPALRPILERYISSYRQAVNSGQSAPRQMDLIYLTDGAASDKEATEKLIVETARTLRDLNAPERQIGIQFVQIGEDRQATEFLRHLDNDLRAQGVDDIVDTRQWHHLQPGDRHLKHLLSRILLGAMDDSIDDQPEEDE
ncbi:hypothetical protein TWF730_003774 [Orbilia blumenaviensis]|uniref:VWFA domain-containing protein n=1 Tax=Orbilia blumenaviensis TaxID=1796055 RepID=A0AAV9U3C1_9PEZI